MRSKQLHFFPKEFMSTDSSFGGENRKGKRKIARPISSNNPIHVVIKSSYAIASLSFVNNRKMLDNILQSTSKKWGVKVMKHSWPWTHLHMIVQVPNRTVYNNWIRELTGRLVNALAKKVDLPLRRFFDHRPFTRVIQWGRDLKNAFDYLDLNEMELFGCRPFKKKKAHAKKKAPSPIARSS